jgi:hypothetical protein
MKMKGREPRALSPWQAGACTAITIADCCIKLHPNGKHYPLMSVFPIEPFTLVMQELILHITEKLQRNYLVIF